MKILIFSGSFSPFVSTPEEISTAYGSKRLIASFTFSAFKPP
ncbi:conserved hypothetical protein, partial [Listeria innocua FSL S4-378]